MYTLKSGCGFPEISLNTSAFDVVVAQFDTTGTLWDHALANFPFFDNETYSYTSGDASKNFTTKYYGFDDKSAESCDKNRTLVVTVTNVNKPAQSWGELHSSRMLQSVPVVAGNITFGFGSGDAKPLGALHLISTVSLAAMLALVALFF